MYSLGLHEYGTYGISSHIQNKFCLRSSNNVLVRLSSKQVLVFILYILWYSAFAMRNDQVSLRLLGIMIEIVKIDSFD